MKIKIAGYKWKPKHLNELKCLKKRIEGFLKEHAAAKRYQIDGKLENEAEKWFRESQFPQNYLKNANKEPIIILRDDIGFPFELLMVDGVFLGQKYNIYRETSLPYQPNRNFKICYQFEENDEAYQYYQYIENTFPLELMEPVSENISANVFHVSGHFEKREKEKILTRSINKNVVLFFNSCSTFEYRNRGRIKSLAHCILSYFAIPLENPRSVEDFPYFFYQYLLGGEDISTAFLKARRKYIDHTGCLTPLLFTLITADPRAHIFHTPYCLHHKEIEKQIKRVEKDIHQIRNNRKYPLFLFECTGNKKKTLQSLLNIEPMKKAHELHELTRNQTKNNKKFLQGGLNQWVSGSVGQKERSVEGEKVRSSKRRLKASKPCMPANSHELSSIRHLDAFAADAVHLKKPSVGPKGLIGPPCHGAPWPPEARNIWIHGEKAGIGKTFLLYQVFQLFKYGKFKGPFFISFKEDPGLRRLHLKNLEQYLYHYLKIDNEAKQLPRNGKKYLLLVDAIENNSYFYHHFDRFVDELKEIFGACRIIVASRERCPLEDFWELSMEIIPGDANARRLRASYNIENNIKLPDIPLAYRLFSGIRGRSENHLEMNKSRIFSEFILRYQEKAIESNPFGVMPETFQRFLAILAFCQFKTGTVTQRQFIEALKQFKQDHLQDIDWWIYDKERKSYRDAESICGFLLSTHIIVRDNDDLVFIHDSFYEYLLAYYFSWQGVDEVDEDEISQFMFTEVPDYMKELVISGIYAGNFPPGYLRLVFDRLFYVRDYQSIEEILSKQENQELIKTSDQLWYCLVKGCYFARNPVKNIDELRAFQVIDEFTQPDTFFNMEKLKQGNRSLLETCFALLNILFDNNLLEEFFRLAEVLTGVFPTLEIYGLLSRGYLKINQIDKGLEYLKLKEQEIQSSPGNEKHRIRLHAEKGLLYYYKYLETRNHDYFDRGIDELTKAENHYKSDKREEGNYLFTLREFLRFYLAGKNQEEFARVIQRINNIGSKDHPKTDYIPYLQGMAAIEMEENIDAGINYLLAGAAGFYENQLLFESAVACLWAFYYCGDSQKKTEYLTEAIHIFNELEEKRNKIKKYWAPFDEYLKVTRGALFEKTAPLDAVKHPQKLFIRGVYLDDSCSGNNEGKKVPGFSNPYDRLKGILEQVDEDVLAYSHQFRDVLEDIVLVA
jgi:hypothetical protein